MSVKLGGAIAPQRVLMASIVCQPRGTSLYIDGGIQHE